MEIDLQIFLEILVNEGCFEPKRYEYDGSVNYRIASPNSNCFTIVNGDEEFIDKDIADEHIVILGMFELIDRIPYQKMPSPNIVEKDIPAEEE